MAEFSVEDVQESGLEPTFNSANAGGDSCQNDGVTYLTVKNGDASDHTLTFDRKRNSNLGQDVDRVVTVPAGSEVDIGPFPRKWFSSLLEWTYDDVTSVTVAVKSLSGVVPA